MSDSTTTKVDENEAQQSVPPTPSKSDEGKITKFFRVACNSTLNQVIAACEQSRLVELYSPVIKLDPRMADRLHATLTKVIKEQFQYSLEALITDDNLDEKFKVLDKIAKETIDCKKKAWRPTGLSPEEQLMRHDAAVKTEMLEELQAAVAAKQERVRELREQVAASRALAKQLEEKVSQLHVSAATQYEQSNNLAESVLASVNKNLM